MDRRALATFFALALAFVVALYVAHLRLAMRKLRHMEDSRVAFLAEEPSFTITSKIATSTLAWNTVIEVWRFRTFWVLMFSKAHFFPLPLAGMSPEMQAFVLQRIQGSGGKIDG